MSREYTQYPDHVLVETPTGLVKLSITENNHIYINGSQECRQCGRSLTQTVRGREVSASLHVNDYGKGFEPSRDSSCPTSSYNSFYSSKATEAQRKAIIAAWVPAVNAFMAAHPELRSAGNDAHANNRIMSIEEEITELEQKIAAKRAEINSLKTGVEPRQGVILFSCCGAYGKPNPNHKCDAPRYEMDNS